MKSIQKEIFLKHEGDNWYLRNKKNLSYKNLNNKILISEVSKLIKNKKLNVLEIGCSNGNNLVNLKKIRKNCNYFGIDPSRKAINILNKKKIEGRVGTADKLDFKDNSMDIIIYGFCLYLCDISLYDKIFKEAYRVLKKKGHIVIFDFYSKKKFTFNYVHDLRIRTIKRDFKKIFLKKNSFILKFEKFFLYNKIFKKNNVKNKDKVSLSILQRRY